MGNSNEGMYIYPRWCRSLSLMLSCLTVSFSCGIVYSRGNRTPESKKNQTSVYLMKRKMKKKNFVYVQKEAAPPTAVAAAAAAAAAVEKKEEKMPSNGKWKIKFCIRTEGSSTTNSSSSSSSQYPQRIETTVSTPNRNPPELLVKHTSHIHTLFR